MFDSSDVQSVFSGNIAEEWEKKSRYINSLNGNDNMMIPTIKKYITSTSKILEVGCGTGKLLSQIDALTFGIELTGVEMSSDMLQQIDTLRFKNPVRLINDSVENFIDDNKYDIIVMKQVLHHIVSREQVLKKLAGYLNPNGVIIIMTPNDGYQKSILPFNPITDLLGRIDDSMIYEYIKDLPLQVVEIQHVNSLATFNSLYEYFMFLYAIGSLQKIFNYKGEYEYALKLITVFKNLFSKRMKIMIAGAWDETNENLLSSAFQIAKVAAEKKHIIITGGGTGIPNSATHGALAVNGISIAYSNEGHCEGGHEPATFRVATEMGWDGRSVLAVKSSDLLIVIGGCNGTLNEITLAYLNNIPIWVLEDSSEMICRLKNFLYEGKYIDKRKNVEIEFFNSAQSMIEKLNSKNILQN